MDLILDGILAFFAAVGIAFVCFIICHGRIRWIHRAESVSTYVLLYAQGDGMQLQPFLTHLHRNYSFLSPQIIVVDNGLNPQGQQAVATLMRHLPEMQCCTKEGLSNILPPQQQLHRS